MPRLRAVTMGQLNVIYREYPKRTKPRRMSKEMKELDSLSKQGNLCLPTECMERYANVRASYFIDMADIKVNKCYKHKFFDICPVYFRPLKKLNGYEEYKAVVVNSERHASLTPFCVVDVYKTTYLCQVIRPSQYGTQPLIKEEIVPEWYLNEALDWETKVAMKDALKILFVDDRGEK